MTRTVEDSYQNKVQRIEIMADFLKQEIIRHKQHFENSGSNDWSMVGDLGYIETRIADALAFISCFTETEIKEAVLDV